ncbi:PREDICTED: uncharacterized protein LOC109173068 [Ipomoea nil]|uniref:uncharacterized protein LOC109173068 n=1 Tax=Ipomoea nil TaxID=35883 RepID=UPI00090091A7|nr:PREDICTED: uncharacterized protein LOC109173068 [Ipomoea nil]
MAWRPPSANMVQQGAPNPAGQASTSNQNANPTQIPASGSAANFDPNDQTNPLHLHANESPTLQLVTVQLEGRSNYHSWARAMEMALRSKNKMSFVNGLVAAPNKLDPRYYYWERCNTMLLSWILRALSPTIASSVLWINTAEGVWKDLKKRFSHQDVFRVAEIQSQIYQTRQGNSNINEYFTQLKLLWDELLVLRPIPSCECTPSCACGNNMAEKVKTHLENDMLSAFFIGLNDSYTNTRHQIMLMKPLPDVGEAFSMVSQQERQVNIEASGLGDNITRMNAFFTRANNSRRAFPNQKQKPVCSFCGYTGHTIEKCYKKNGYPPGWKPRNKGMSSVNQVQGPVQESASSGSLETSHSFTQEDCRRFFEFMQQEKARANTPLDLNPQINTIAANFIPNSQFEGTSTNTESEWIIDSGATHHIVCSTLLLHTSKKVQGVNVDLPNGHHAEVSHIGTVHLSADLILQNVLCVPLFHYNLISLGQLLKGSNYSTVFHTDQCIIQDQHYGKMIGVARLKEGLYHLTFPISAHCKSVGFPIVNTCSFWHARLGHASEGKIKVLHALDNKICNDKPTACECCHMAKQKRFPFQSNSSTSTHCFDLVHVDIWGPFHVATVYGHKYFLTLVDDHSRAT